MYALIIGRSYPEKATNMIGIFEYEQAKALKKHGLKTVYGFVDNRSIKVHQRFKNVQFYKDNIEVYGSYFPIGGLHTKLFNKLKTYYFRQLIYKIISKHGTPKIIHIHFPMHTINLSIWEFLKELKSEIVITEHWGKVQTKDITNKHKELLTCIVKESKAFICVSEKLKKSVEELTNVRNKIKVIPNMLNYNFYYHNHNNNNNKQPSFNFISIGRLEYIKRFEMLIKAFSMAFPNHKDIYLQIIGDGPLFKELQQLIQKKRLTDRVIMHGFLSRKQTANLLRKSDVYVSASILETFGVPFIEAMACGKPVIGVKDGPLDQFILMNEGSLFKRDDVKELADELKKTYLNKNNFNNEEISQTTLNYFSETIVVEKLLHVYNEKL